jgi:hypothetical protein
MVAFLMSSISVSAQIQRGSQRQTQVLVNRIESRTDTFKRAVDMSLSRTPLTSTSREDRITDFIAAFETATDSLRQGIAGNRDVTDEINEVLTRATFIDRFMTRNRLSVRAQTEWNGLRNDLNSLARFHSVSWNWNRMPDYGPEPGMGTGGGRGYGRGGFDSRITGTYRLNRSLSDDVNAVLDRSDDTYPPTDRDRLRRSLERRLTSPTMMAIEKSGRTITMASSLSPQVSFEADGVARTETTPRGRTIRTTVTSTRDAVEISYVGERSNDFYLTLSPTRDGQLRVTRRLYVDNRNETVSVSSVYDKIDPIARWSDVNLDNSPMTGTDTGAVSGDFYIPNGTRLTAVLNQPGLTTRGTQIGDRFTLNVTSPDIYRNAVIEGRVAQIDNSGRLSGRANVSLEFDTIRMRDGRTYRFAGIIDSVRAANGDTVSVNNEGTIRDRNQTTRTATRAGVGAALGALIGAIAGGGSGAAVGAVVGAGAGAGTVLVQGRDNVELGQGTEFTITATGPTGNRVGGIR